MQRPLSPRLLAFGTLAATALALAVSVGAQTTVPPAPPPAPTGGQRMDMAPGSRHDPGMMAECQAMMARKQAMEDERQAQDAALDKLVAEMNAARSSRKRDALEEPMAAVLTELVAQRRASHTMMMKMQPEMMAHMMRHMSAHGTMGMMDCPMMGRGMSH